MCSCCPSLSPSLLIEPWDVEYVSAVLFCFILDIMLCCLWKKKKKKIVDKKKKKKKKKWMNNSMKQLITETIHSKWIHHSGFKKEPRNIHDSA